MEVRRAELFWRGQRGDLIMSLITLLMQGGSLLALFFLPWVGVGGLLLAATGPLGVLKVRRARAPAA